jgi:methylenetetrahydrofolate dehydrogenase (NADP+) / methenyltetrahydrofolate cyclohydrolase
VATILSGTIVRDALASQLKDEIQKIASPLALVILQVGNRPDSTAYINQKKRLGEKIGVQVIHEQYNEDVAEAELLNTIKKYNIDPNVHGILVQIPLPLHLNKETLIEAIDPRKDVDGLTAYNTKLLFNGEKGGHIPATARGIISLLAHYKISLPGKHVVVVGRSTLVGKPTFSMKMPPLLWLTSILPI